MTPGSPFSRAVVGIDGSKQSLAALSWASRFAAPDAVIHTVEVSTSDATPDGGEPRPRVDPGGVTIVSHRPRGAPAAAILAAAAEVDADVVVVGIHQQWPYFPRRLGRVISELIRTTERPLVVVRPEQRLVESESSQPRAVVAGVGHGAATRTALHWAAAFAAGHDTGLDLVRALPLRPLFRTDGFLDTLAYYVDPDLIRRWAVDDLEAFADEIERATDREVPLQWSTAHGATGTMLIEASAEAELLVLGLHERSAATEHDVPLWLYRAVTHAQCPVALIPVPLLPAPSIPSSMSNVD